MGAKRKLLAIMQAMRGAWRGLGGYKPEESLRAWKAVPLVGREHPSTG